MSDPNPQPWLNIEAVNYYRELIKSAEDQVSVLELGCGNSTLWLGNLGCEVKAYEHNIAWMHKIVKQIKPTQNISITFGLPYFQLLKYEVPRYDIIVIDGVHRKECFEQILKYDLLQSETTLVVDDSQRADDTPGMKMIVDTATQNAKKTVVKEVGYQSRYRRWSCTFFHY